MLSLKLDSNSFAAAIQAFSAAVAFAPKLVMKLLVNVGVIVKFASVGGAPVSRVTATARAGASTPYPRRRERPMLALRQSVQFINAASRRSDPGRRGAGIGARSKGMTREELGRCEDG